MVTRKMSGFADRAGGRATLDCAPQHAMHAMQKNTIPEALIRHQPSIGLV
jgi:hypothetical protein